MDITQANTVLEDLKSQLKQAQERVNVLDGAVQGAELIINSLLKEEQEVLPEAADEIVIQENAVNGKSTSRKRKSSNPDSI